MSTKIDPFAMEPTRANVLQLPQILKEVSSLETSIAQIQAAIKDSNVHIQKLKLVPKVDQVTSIPVSSENTTSKVYQTQGPLPQRFEEPGMSKLTRYMELQGEKAESHLYDDYEPIWLLQTYCS
jgi:hypothetical protein